MKYLSILILLLSCSNPIKSNNLYCKDKFINLAGRILYCHDDNNKKYMVICNADVDLDLYEFILAGEYKCYSSEMNEDIYYERM